jgi:hypothetical protein
MNLVSDYCPCCGGVKNKIDHSEAGISYVYTVYLRDPANMWPNGQQGTTSIAMMWDTALTVAAKNSNQAILKLPAEYKSWGVVKIDGPTNLMPSNSTIITNGAYTPTF